MDDFADINPYESPAPEGEVGEVALEWQFETPDNAASVVVLWPWIAVVTADEIACAYFFLRSSFDAAQRKLQSGHDPRQVLGAQRNHAAWHKIHSLIWVDGSRIFHVRGRYWYSTGYMWNLPPQFCARLIEAIDRRKSSDFEIDSKRARIVDLPLDNSLVPSFLIGGTLLVLGLFWAKSAEVDDSLRIVGWPLVAIGVATVIGGIVMAFRQRPLRHVVRKKA